MNKIHQQTKPVNKHQHYFNINSPGNFSKLTPSTSAVSSLTVSAILWYMKELASPTASSVDMPFILHPHKTEANKSPVPEKLLSKKWERCLKLPLSVTARLYIKEEEFPTGLIPVITTSCSQSACARSFTAMSSEKPSSSSVSLKL